MKFLLLFFEFFKTGLFSVGGGLATLPFLYSIAERYDWFTVHQLTDMIAVSESTPGSIGMNMATFAGFTTAGVLGGLAATLGLLLPSLLIILVLARFYMGFNEKPVVKAAFSCIRPAVCGMIAAACWQVARVALFTQDTVQILNLSLPQISAGALILFVILFTGTQKLKWHPAAFIAIAAVAGIVFKF
ncbi:MAG: chromate transporter [Ruminococcaceae bacterium]|nr:chromate transporter [Oscillospiraceae bacterium]